MQNFVRTFDPAIIYRPRRYLAQNHRWKLLYPEIKSDRNLNVWSRVKNSHLYLQRHRFVASPLDYDLPWHRITLEPRMSYPALRVTRIHFHLKINVFFDFSLNFSLKFIENQIFSNFSNFSKNVQNFIRTFDPAIIYRLRRYIAQNHRWNLLYPKIKSDRNLNGWSRFKKSHLYLQRHKFVASPPDYDLP